MQMELNIGLDVAGAVNTIDTRDQREQQAMLTLCAFLVGAERFTTTYTGPAGEVTEHSLFVRLETNKLFSIVRHVYRLAKALEQDCIAVFYPARQDGVLIGPRADAWGVFDATQFKRFDTTPARLAA